jgi:hypothetical protein
MIVTLNYPFFEEKYEIRVYGKTQHNQYEHSFVTSSKKGVVNFLLRLHHRILHNRLLRLWHSARVVFVEQAWWRAWIRGGLRKRATTPVRDCNSSARRAELSSLHKESNWRCFVSSKKEPPPPDYSSSSRRAKLCSLRKGARQTAARGRKEVYGGQQLLTHHGDEALLCRCVASPRPPAAIDGAARVTVCRMRWQAPRRWGK